MAQRSNSWRAPITAPGPTGGEMLRSIRRMRRDPIGFLDDQWRAHGDIVQFPIPRPPTYLLSRPEDVRAVLVEHARDESKRTLQYDNLALITGDGLLTADDPPWRAHRRIIQPSFHHGQLESVSALTNILVNQLADSWDALPDGSVVDVDEAMMALSLQVVAGALFGSDWRDQANELTKATVVALDCVVRRARNPLPIPLRVPTPDNIRLARARLVLDKAVMQLIRSRAINASSHETRTLVDHLVEGLRTPDGGVDFQAVRDEVVTFLVAGHETVASALTWTWHLLSINEAARARLFAEVDAVGGAFDSESVPFAGAVVDEVLRLFPPAWVITRKSRIPLRFSDVEIPRDSLLIMSPWIVHRHPSVWNEPNEFRPQRFIEASSRNHPGYLPFGLGPRMCVGRDFALAEAVVVVAGIAARFALDAIERDAESIASVTLRPVNGLEMSIRSRS